MVEDSDRAEAEAEAAIRGFAESKTTIPAFFKQVVKNEDTTKTGNLMIEELGMPNLPLRTDKKLEVFCEDIAGQKEWAEYFKKCGEITTSSSLSKDGFLMKLLVTSKREMADTTPQPKKENSGWFKSKKPQEGTQ